MEKVFNYFIIGAILLILPQSEAKELNPYLTSL